MTAAAGALRSSPLILALVLAAACGGGVAPLDLSGLEAQGEAGRLALDLMEAHGGAADFHALGDVELSVQAEHFDSAGALRGTVRELHRFQAAPPARYLLRRTGGKVVELGLAGERGWARVDGVPQPGGRPAEVAAEELRLLWILNRAPFCLADPGVQVSLITGASAPGDGLRRLAVEVGGPDGPRPRRFVFFIDGVSGLLQRVLFEVPGDAGGLPLREARAEGYQTVPGTRLVSAWSLTAAGPDGVPLGLPDTRWTVAEVRTGNGFTDQLYEANGAP